MFRGFWLRVFGSYLVASRVHWRVSGWSSWFSSSYHRNQVAEQNPNSGTAAFSKVPKYRIQEHPVGL